MKYKIITYGDPVLREKARPVECVDKAIKQLASDMISTMHDNNGIGVAAEQIGRTEAICVIDISPLSDNPNSSVSKDNIPMPLVLVNPSIVEKKGKEIAKEGCLSFPEIFASIKRFAEVTVEFISLRGKKEKIHADGLLARAIQHEIDHLNGVLLADRMSPVQKVSMSGKLKRLRKTYKG